MPAQSRNFDQFQRWQVGSRDVRGLGPIPTEHHRHAPLRVVPAGIVIAADLLTGRHFERIVEGERRQAAILGNPEAVQRGEHGSAQSFAEPERATRSLRELRPLDRPVVILVLELSVLAQLRERGTERDRHHAVGCGLYEIARHSGSRHCQSG